MHSFNCSPQTPPTICYKVNNEIFTTACNFKNPQHIATRLSVKTSASTTTALQSHWFFNPQQHFNHNNISITTTFQSQQHFNHNNISITTTFQSQQHFNHNSTSIIYHCVITSTGFSILSSFLFLFIEVQRGWVPCCCIMSSCFHLYVRVDPSE